MIKSTHSQPQETQAAKSDSRPPETADPTLGQPPKDGLSSETEALGEAISEVATEAAEAAAADRKSPQSQQLPSQLAEAEDRALRAYAELENYRKRANRLLQEEVKYAPLPLLRDLLPVVDNLERAIQSADQSGGSAGLLEGVKMVAQQLLAVLDQHDCRRMDPKGSPFDPHLHEAVTQIPSQDLPPGTVAEVLLSGYQLHERVVRPAQVLVSARPAAKPAPATGEEATEN
ncbi:MAG: nucleotide exchange factor GrpE [Candidatus Anammoximicrobium sp.]|nr:nucleotide exchange factor GrpE [Candidatus Anammoximicrobium sp.]